MKCLEVAAAVLAEVLIQNGVNIDVETECIHWLIADIVTGPPTNVVNKGKRGAKVPKKLISGKSGQVFGQIVNDIQRNQLAMVLMAIAMLGLQHLVMRLQLKLQLWIHLVKKL